MYVETLRERDRYELEHLGGYDIVYPPMLDKQVDEEKMGYYKLFIDYSKKFMMDFKVSKGGAEDTIDKKAVGKDMVKKGVGT